MFFIGEFNNENLKLYLSFVLWVMSLTFMLIYLSFSLFLPHLHCSYITPAHAAVHLRSYCSLTGGSCLFNCEVRIIFPFIDLAIVNLIDVEKVMPIFVFFIFIGFLAVWFLNEACEKHTYASFSRTICEKVQQLSSSGAKKFVINAV